MRKVAPILAFVSCALVTAGVLTGCSVGSLPGGPQAAAGTTPPTPSAVSAPTTAPAAPTPVPATSTNSPGLATGKLVAVPKDCPPTADMSTFFPAQLQTETVDPGPQTLECIYKSGSVDHVLAVVFRFAPAGTDVDDLKAEIDEAATDPDDRTGEIDGLGQAAYYYANSEEAGLLVLNGGVTFSVVDGYDISSLENIARSVLTE